MILDDDHSRVPRFDPHFARGNEDAEIRDRGLRPVQESFGDGTLVFGFDSIELAVFGRAAGANEFELHAVHIDALHRPFDESLLGFIQHAAGNVEPRDTNLRKQALQQRVVKLRRFLDIRNPGFCLPIRVNVERDHKHGIIRCVCR